MGTTADKLNKILQSKQAIKAAIEAKGVADVGDVMSLYADKIASIQSGGGTETKYTGHADAEGLKAIGWTDEDIQYYQENGVNWNEEDDEYHKVPQENIDLHGILNENNIKTYKDSIVYLPKIEITKTDCSSMFRDCYSLVSIPLLDTSNVTDMYDMFGFCYSLTSIPLLDTSKVTDMGNMFYYCYSLVSIPLLNTSKVTDMGNMFYYCYSLVSIPLLNTSNVTDMSGMFYSCYSLVTIPQLDTSKINKILNIFQNCYSLVSIPLIDSSRATDCRSIYRSCYSLVSIQELNLANSTTLSWILDYTYSLQNVKLINLNQTLSINYSPLLSKESLLYMIQNAAPTSAITITLHSNVYDKYIEDPDIVSALSAQPNITLAK